MLKFGFTNESKEKVSKDIFGKLVKKFYKVLKNLVDKKLVGRNGSIELVLVNDNAIKDLNREYRRKNKPTDVISFAYLEVTEYKKTKGEIIVGDIFISVDTAKKQARENGHSLVEELKILFVHGLLHCLGFDHRTDKEEKEMEGWANKVLD